MRYQRYTISGGLRKAKRRISAAVAGLAALAFPVAIALSGGAASALGGSYTTFGSATAESDGVHLVSDATHAYSGATLGLPAGVSTVGDLTTLEATFQVLTGDCHGGALRYSVETAVGNIFVYVGDAPNFTHCANGSTGNLLTSPDLRVDTSQVGGTFYDTWANAVTLAGTQSITSLDLVADGGWAGDQAFLLTSATVNTTNYSFLPAPSKETCKNNGWKTMTNPGPFKNQGDCVSFFATKGKNLPAVQ